MRKIDKLLQRRTEIDREIESERARLRVGEKKPVKKVKQYNNGCDCETCAGPSYSDHPFGNERILE